MVLRKSFEKVSEHLYLACALRLHLRCSKWCCLVCWRSKCQWLDNTHHCTTFLAFPPVWTILYIFIATSAYRTVIAQPHHLKGITYALWALQLCLNTLWTPVFFGAYDLLGALVIIIFLWIAIVCYTVISYKIDKIAAYLFIPYLAWVSFATLLNFEYLRIN